MRTPPRNFCTYNETKKAKKQRRYYVVMGQIPDIWADLEPSTWTLGCDAYSPPTFCYSLGFLLCAHAQWRDSGVICWLGRTDSLLLLVQAGAASMASGIDENITWCPWCIEARDKVIMFSRQWVTPLLGGFIIRALFFSRPISGIIVIASSALQQDLFFH